MYLEYWKLREKPFELTPDEKYMYYSREHEEALLRLCYTVKELKGAMLLTGITGCGKTMLSRVFLNELKGPKFEIALVSCPNYGAKELLEEIVFQLVRTENEEPLSKPQLLRTLQDIVKSNLAAGKETIIMIDEAQVIEDVEAFEQLRLLLNYQYNNRFMLTLVLIGHMKLMDKLNKLPQFKQRLVINYHINALDQADTLRYIDHRLHIAGAQRSLFDRQAKELIYKTSSGVPRVINGIADLALLYGFEKQLHVIDASIVNQAARTSNLEPSWSV